MASERAAFTVAILSVLAGAAAPDPTPRRSRPLSCTTTLAQSPDRSLSSI